MTNLEIAQALRRVAAAYQIIGENRFRITAYERAADSIEHLTREAKDIWEDGKLVDIPGVGSGIAQYLDELFRTGYVRHFKSVMEKVPAAVFPLLFIPGLGPKKAYKLVTELKLKNPRNVIDDLEAAAKKGKIAPIEGFGDKSEQDVLSGIAVFKKGQIKENRMILPEAETIADKIIAYLEKFPDVVRVDCLGSLRRKVATIGDIDIAVATDQPEKVVSYFLEFPHQKILEKGPTGASILLANGRQIDLRVQKPASYGAMLQYFTGSKHHNIKLREYALERGLSLSEHGIKNLRSKKVKEYAGEEEFYQDLGLAYIPPELREDQGEIEAASRQGLSGKERQATRGKPDSLPDLVELKEIKGDLHLHTNYDLEPSHDLGVNTIAEHLSQALILGYEYIGLSDHNPNLTHHTLKQIVEIMKLRKLKYEQQYSSWVKRVYRNRPPGGKYVNIFVMCEADILTDGQLALPEEAFSYVDAVIVAVHSAFNQTKEKMTERILKAMTSHPKVRVLAHPCGRLLGKREGYEVDWDKIFSACRAHDIALEINAYPQRLDLPDNVVFAAAKEGLRFCINSDAHATAQMDFLRWGVTVARRGWAEKSDIVNTMGYNDFKAWLMKGE